MTCPNCGAPQEPAHKCTTGSDLRDARGITSQAAVARNWCPKVSRAHISMTERRLIIPDSLRTRYLEALARAREAGDHDKRVSGGLRWSRPTQKGETK